MGTFDSGRIGRRWEPLTWLPPSAAKRSVGPTKEDNFATFARQWPAKTLVGTAFGACAYKAPALAVRVQSRRSWRAMSMRREMKIRVTMSIAVPYANVWKRGPMIGPRVLRLEAIRRRGP